MHSTESTDTLWMEWVDSSGWYQYCNDHYTPIKQPDGWKTKQMFPVITLLQAKMENVKARPPGAIWGRVSSPWTHEQEKLGIYSWAALLSEPRSPLQAAELLSTGNVQHVSIHVKEADRNLVLRFRGIPLWLIFGFYISILLLLSCWSRRSFLILVCWCH